MRTVRTSQPQQPVGIDWGNPITRGLALCVNGTYTSATVGNFISASGNFASVTNAGKSNSFEEANSTLGLRYSVAPFSSSAFTLMWFGVAKAARPTWPDLISIENAAGTTTYGVLEVPRTSTYTNGIALYEIGFTGARSGGAGLVNNIGKPVVASATVSSGNVKIYVDGKEPETDVPVAWTGGNSVSSIRLHNRTSGTRQIAGDMVLACAWNRALSDAEIKSLSYNPWQIFQPTNRAIWTGFETPAGGSPYTLTADTANVAVNGTDTTLAFNRKLVADAASLAVNGTATGLAFNRRLIADTANVPTAGSAANLIATRRLTSDTTNLAVTGNPATLTFTPVGGPTHTLTADTAGVALTGTTTGLAFNRRLIADTANIAIAGTDTGLARGYTLAADTAALGVSGTDAALIAVRKMVSEAYALAIAANDATLTYTPLTLPTLGRPASDTSNTGWTASTGSDLYAMIDEVTPSAADYISASSVGAVCQVALNTTAYPGSASQVLKYSASSSTGNSVIVRLKEGATVIRSATQALTSVDTEYSITLTSGEIAAITSGALSVELESA